MNIRYLSLIFALLSLTHAATCSSAFAGVPTGKGLKKLAQSLKKKGLKSLPSASSTVENNTSSASASARGISSAVTSGTPPTLSTLATSASIKEVFWRSGVIDAIGTGSPTQNQCQEFFSSDVDGESGGLGSCRMAEGVGHSFQTILDSETSLCYMKNFPTKKNVKAGAVKKIKGKLPDNDITQLFSVGTKQRIVKVNVEPQESGERIKSEHIFIRIPSSKENKRDGFLYRADLYFCPDGDTQARGYNLIQVSSDGIFKIITGNASDPFGGGSHSLTVQGYVEKSGGSLVWDRTTSRTATVDNMRNENERFKASFEITSEDLIILKTKGSFPFNSQNDYTITRFLGSDVKSAVFVEGAYKAESEANNFSKTFSGAVEYRDTRYAAAPSNSLAAQVAAFDMDNDEFYTSLPTLSVDTSAYDCNATPTIEINMKKNDTLDQALKPCFQNRLRDMEFCRSDDAVQAALQAFPNQCGIGGGGNGPGGGGPPPGP